MACISVKTFMKTASPAEPDIRRFTVAVTDSSAYAEVARRAAEAYGVPSALLRLDGGGDGARVALRTDADLAALSARSPDDVLRLHVAVAEPDDIADTTDATAATSSSSQLEAVTRLLSDSDFSGVAKMPNEEVLNGLDGMESALQLSVGAPSWHHIPAFSISSLFASTVACEGAPLSRDGGDSDRHGSHRRGHRPSAWGRLRGFFGGSHGVNASRRHEGKHAPPGRPELDAAAVSKALAAAALLRDDAALPQRVRDAAGKVAAMEAVAADGGAVEAEVPRPLARRLHGLAESDMAAEEMVAALKERGIGMSGAHRGGRRSGGGGRWGGRKRDRTAVREYEPPVDPLNDFAS